MTDTFADTPFGATRTAGPGWGWIMAYGIVSLLVGLAAFAWPFAATFAATLVIGSLFFVSGVFAIAAGIFGQGSESRGYTIFFGVLSVIAGAIMIMEPATGALSLTLIVIVWLAARGAMELIWGFRIRRGRGWMIALGIINILLALYILATVPWSAMTLPGFLLGVSFVFGGITAIAAASDHRKGAAAFAVPE